MILIKMDKSPYVKNTKMLYKDLSRKRWNKLTTSLLLQNVQANWNDLNDAFIKKSSIWERIANKFGENGIQVTGTDCDKKFRHLRVNYTSALRDVEKQEKFEFFHELHTIFATDRHLLVPKRKVVESTSVNISESESFCTSEEDEDINEEDVWPNETVDLFLSLVKEFEDVFEDYSNKMTIPKMFNIISQHMRDTGFKVNSTSCQTQWNCLLKKYYTFKELNSAKSWSYYQKIENILNAINFPIDMEMENDVQCYSERRQINKIDANPPVLLKQHQGGESSTGKKPDLIEVTIAELIANAELINRLNTSDTYKVFQAKVEQELCNEFDKTISHTKLKLGSKI